MSAARRYKLGIDIGGTFTDLALLELDGDRTYSHKVQSTPQAPSKAVARGICELMTRVGSQPDAIESFVHGTTIALNALLERRGTRVALFVTRGNRDLLEIGRLQKDDQFNLRAAAPEPLVPRRRVVEVTERTGSSGELIVTLDRTAVAAALEQVIASEPDAFAVCFLNAHVNGTNEALAAQIIEERFPGSHCSQSTGLWPEIREYERGMVAVLNAYVQPVLSRYVEALERDTAEIGLRARLYITQSNGGIMSAATAKTKPVNTLLSGPASGVVGAAYIAKLCGVAEAVTLDIGGTSADVSLIRNGEPVHSTEAKVGDFPVVMPSVDVFAVGAGGGSIAWFDPIGLLKVGPQSAGASPGPAAYGQGGTEPTVTDAYIVSGFIDPGNFVGGTMKLDRRLAEQAVGKIAARLGVGLEQAAESILQIATSNMITALLPMMTKRGVDPRDFALIPFGGAGATHACLLADEIVIPRIIVPPSPGTTCALGAAIADVKADYIKTFRARLHGIDGDAIRSAYRGLEAEGRAWIDSENPIIDRLDIQRSADMRYAGQAFDVEVEVPDAIAEIDSALLARRFHETYERLYGTSDPSAPIELINLRVRALGRTPALKLRRLERAASAEPRAKGARPIWLSGRWHEAKLYDRAALLAGHVVHGPAIIEQFDTTTVVAPGFAATNDEHGVLTLERVERSH